MQRVASARVVVDGVEIAAIERGFVLLVGFASGDGDAQVAWMARKIAGLRIFADAAGLMNADLRDVNGSVLAVPNFTLVGDCRKGKRPSFSDALPPVTAAPLFQRFVDELRAHTGGTVAAGRFGADMRVALVNDGPVTLVVDT